MSIHSKQIWTIRRKRWPQLWALMQKAGKSQEEFLRRISRHYGWTIPQAYIATEFMFRPKENFN